MSNRYEVTNESGIDYFNLAGNARVGTMHKGVVFTMDAEGFILGVVKGLELCDGPDPRSHKIFIGTGTLSPEAPTRYGYKEYVEGVIIDNTQDASQVAQDSTTTQSNTSNDKQQISENEGDNGIFNIFSTTVYEISTDDYIKNLEKGLRVKDIRGILGMPHQFLPNTDPRMDGSKDTDAIGRKYAERIISEIPLLMMTPGTPTFMSSHKTAEKQGILKKLWSTITGSDENIDVLTDIDSGKYYSLKYDYISYFQYVNSMLRSAAYFLGIEDQSIDDDMPLSTYDWYGAKGDLFDKGNLRQYLGTYGGSIPFYIDSETSISDSFSNQTTTSQIADTINGLSATAKELNFVLGDVSGMTGVQLDKFTSQENLQSNIETITGAIDNLLGKGNVLSRIAGSAQTILSGGKMVFPKIWDDSNFSRSYSCRLKLISPSGDKLSVYLNILVPIYHLLAFVLPRQSMGQAYYSPFLVRAFYKGLFNVDIGVITNMSVTKGDEGYWTQDGLPTVANVSFDIEDLYDGMFMSNQHDSGKLNIMKNITELDYIANSCGINIDEPDFVRTVKMYKTLYLGWSIDNIFHDKIGMNIFGKAAQWFNNKSQQIFGKF